MIVDNQIDLKQKIETIKEEIRNQFTSDDTPWVIGFSGGKDSTTILQIILSALSELPQSKLTKELHVLTNDTLVENPAIVEYVDEQLILIEKAGKEGLFSHAPHLFIVSKAVPKIEDRFWINLIGKGYPSPNRWFRWCTERLKISPTNDYILGQVSKHGKAIIVLGTRSAESTNRAKSIEKHNLDSINGFKFRKHTLPNAWVYAPISDLSTNEIWMYLMQMPSYWSKNNKKIVALYRNATEAGNECPLVIDTSTPSCGSSRFGCWVCTVVSRDKSMENLIDSGEDWMEPLLEFRNILSDYRDDETKRMTKSRQNTERLGPFKYEVRAELLEKLLEIEDITKQKLISLPELAAIQTQWNYDGSFDYSVSDIYFKVKNKRIMIEETLGDVKDDEELQLLSEVAKEHLVDPNHIRELMLTEKEHVTFLRRRNILDDIGSKIEKFISDKK